eukprot:CAMPEP_0174378052 /NCGR_PEP_ID=MMETSP0811_2-20130205/121812_1 /TAXON_ID=73025 ORGANISM="Eutreptiella gymnastica-like, Strain CCMP1594" /NCGR_SAMPLE_ID=MMETSP0811_2 /ASSEMBLY_ACC=CAM_ASM_000667 /LENGTH=244 /DNA_ID=CAMNT_0015530177 /DNA_START=713 /DNA_END=1447 /DNA_ORIENTATION=-
MEQKPCAWGAARRKKRVIVTKRMCLALPREWDNASDTEMVWAKSARCVWGLAHGFANGKLYFTHDVPQDHCLPQALEPSATSLAKPAPKAAKPRAKPSAKSAAKPAAWVGAKLAAGEPIPVALVEHVQLFTVKYSRQKKWHTEPVCLSTAEDFSQQAVSGSFCGPYALVSCFMSRVLCVVIGRGQGTVTWVMFPRGVQGYRRVQAITVQQRGGGMVFASGVVEVGHQGHPARPGDHPFHGPQGL